MLGNLPFALARAEKWISKMALRLLAGSGRASLSFSKSNNDVRVSRIFGKKGHLKTKTAIFFRGIDARLTGQPKSDLRPHQ